MGWPVEFLSYHEIKNKFGRAGIQDLICLKPGKAQITDDTQMTLFTAEGLLRSETRGNEKGISYPPAVVYYAYLRWLNTQGYPKLNGDEWIYDGWLISVKELHESRAPGNSCLSALASGKQGTIEEPINNSKGCGGIMRVAPVGLFYRKDNAFNLAQECAALTHGHPSGYLSAGALAFMIASIIKGQDIETAVKNTLTELERHDHHQECTHSLRRALNLSQRDLPAVEAISQLGEGWIGEEALIAAVNHNGDSDSTGAITGNILGAYLGLSNIPAEWVEKVELKDVILQIADDLIIRYQDKIVFVSRILYGRRDFTRILFGDLLENEEK